MPGTASVVTIDGTPTDGANAWVDALVWGAAWADDPTVVTNDGAVTVSYFIQDLPGLVWSAEARAAMRRAFDDFEAVANLNFVEAASGASADMVSYLENNGGGILGWAQYPSSGNGQPIVFGADNFSWTPAGLADGGYAYITLLHEIGHAMGLEHPFDGVELFPGVNTSTYGDYNLNQGIYTVMSYSDGWPVQFPGHTPGSFTGWGWSASLMAIDIAAIQAMYGANMSHATGNDTYVMPNVNGVGTYWTSIWDAGGVDTISNAGSTVNSVIDLNAATMGGPNTGGLVSWNTGIIGGFTIANGAVIENAIGGSGNDTINGNAAQNTLNGGNGNDTLDGGAGNDILEGGAGNDALNGGADTDAATYASAASAVSVSLLLASAQNTLGAGTDTLTNIESLIGSAFNDTLTGNTGDNTLTGGAGNDVLDGGLGNDILNGGADNDTLTYANASSGVTVSLLVTTSQNTGGAGNDTLTNFENLIGSGYNDVLTGNNNDNSITGGAGNDTLNGRAGLNTMTGGTGNDLYYVNATTDVIVEASNGGTSDVIYAFSNYTLGAGVYVEQVVARLATAQTLTGNELNNTLQGNTANDTLNGMAGNDTLDGRGGADAMSGGLGNDDYYVDNAGDTVIEAVGEGTVDRVFSAIGYTLAAGQEIERLYSYGSNTGLTLTGNEFNNLLVGGAGNDTLIGGIGNDTIYGQDGNDRLVGGTDRDTLFGGAGSDVFVLQNLVADRDVIRDFQAADQIEVSASLFGGGLVAGVLAANRFASNGTGVASDSDQRFVYNTTNGALYFDIDGNGATARVQIATLTGMPGLTAGDFTVVA